MTKEKEGKLYVAFKVILESVAAEPAGVVGKDLVAFGGMSGTSDETDVLYVGRATNGWEWTFEVESLVDGLDSIVQRAVKSSHKYSDDGDPLSWVENFWGKRDGDYNMARSQFWQTIRQVSKQRKGDGRWWDRIVWTNLLKVAPMKGNPTNAMTKVMGEASLQMILKEIEIYRPKNIVCLTGLSWAANLLSMSKRTERVGEEFEPLEYVGDVVFGDGVSARLIIAPHPQGRSSVAISSRILDRLL